MNSSIAVKLSNISHPSNEGVTLLSGHDWNSPGGGWLALQSGSWDQTPAGLMLNPEGSHGGAVARLLGLLFSGASEGDRGQAQYPDLGEVGTWEIVAVANFDRPTDDR